MEQVGQTALGSVAEQGIAYAVLVAVICGLGWVVRYLLAELKESRKDYIMLVEKSNQVTINNTQVMGEFKEMVRHAVNK